MSIDRDLDGLTNFQEHLTRSHDYRIEHFSFPDAVNLPLDEFRSLYLRLMIANRDLHYWWKNGNNPVCDMCKVEIPEPKYLRMFHEKPYHPECFRQIYEPEKESETMRLFWEKVLMLEK